MERKAKTQRTQQTLKGVDTEGLDYPLFHQKCHRNLTLYICRTFRGPIKIKALESKLRYVIWCQVSENLERPKEKRCSCTCSYSNLAPPPA